MVTRRIIKKSARILEDMTLRLADYIISEVEDIAHERPRKAKYRHKILPWGARFVDTTRFRVTREFSQRNKVVGYIGRLTEEKGILALLDAAPLILERENVDFLLVGDGPLYTEVQSRAQAMNCGEKIALTGFVPHKEVSHYLNRLKLLVLPSSEEGLPTVVLESMGCGTPVVASPIGAVPEVVRHFETGFLLADNSPDSIAQAILIALASPELADISANARALIEKKYTFDVAVERYRRILDTIIASKLARDTKVETR
jgi:glycosyltransferase involved in cell wall biosynthesis